jgi:acyl-CoA synthetase (AMP-forming)/AMP-acid ligase II
MLGLMQSRPLLISTLIEYAGKNHPDTPVISKLPDGRIVATDYRQTEARCKRLANALLKMGVRKGDRIATLAWNTHRHLELYYGVSGIGAICHTINPRLFIDQIIYICRHAEDTTMFFDLTFLDIVQKLVVECPSIKTWVALCEQNELPADARVPGLISYEQFIGNETADLVWPSFDENTASSLCYTSGTTGNPKGVLYSHRSQVLHSYAAAAPDCFNLSARDVILPGSSMYHANAWGVIYAATLVGAKLVLPGSRLDGESLTNLIEAERVSWSSGVPTIWSAVALYLESSKRKIDSLQRLIIGGAACPLSLCKVFGEKFDVEVRQIWGMTETSPLGVVNTFKSKHDALGENEKDDVLSKQGRIVYGVQLEIVDADSRPLPHDGKAFGDVLVKGWWIASGYFGDNSLSLNAEGWFATGDVATLDEDGYMRITDRSKDVIKSGGEWISSIDIENAAVGHPDVTEAAVVGVPHPKWDERPLLIVVQKADSQLSKQSVRDFLQDKVAKWWLPDDVIFVDEIPHTSTGKILKTTLRERYQDHFANGSV